MSYNQQTGAYPPPPYTGPPPQQGYGAPPPGYGAPQPAQPGYAPPPPGQPIQVQQTTNTVVVQAPTVVGMRFGEHPVRIACQFCSATVVTATTKKVGSFTWMWVGGICFIGCFVGGATWFGCCLVPFYLSSMKDTEHTCPNCSRCLGTYSKAF